MKLIIDEQSFGLQYCVKSNHDTWGGRDGLFNHSPGYRCKFCREFDSYKVILNIKSSDITIPDLERIIAVHQKMLDDIALLDKPKVEELKIGDIIKKNGIDHYYMIIKNGFSLNKYYCVSLTSHYGYLGEFF